MSQADAMLLPARPAVAGARAHPWRPAVTVTSTRVSASPRPRATTLGTAAALFGLFSPFRVGAALGVAVTGTVLAARTDLAHGLGPCLRTSAPLLLAATAAVLDYRERRGKTPAATGARLIPQRSTAGGKTRIPAWR